jgi:uncharacterized membrane protein
LDEVFTWQTATASFRSFLPTLTANENTPPLYFFIVNLWTHVVGNSDVALRLPSAIFGVGCVAGIYFAGRELGSAGAGLVASMILAISPYHLWYSQEARTYALVFLLVVCSVAFQGRLHREPARWALIGYTLTGALSLYAHPFAVFTLTAQNLFFILCWLSRSARPATTMRMWLTLNGAIAVAFTPWIGRTIDLARTGQPWMTRNSTVAEAMSAYAGSTAILALLGMLAIAGIAYALARRDPRPILSLLILIFPIAIPLALSTAKQPAFHVRYGILSLFGMALLAGFGVMQIRPWARMLTVAAYIALAAPRVAIAGYPIYPGVLVRTDMRSAANIVARDAAPGDCVILTEGWWMNTVFARYCRRSDLKSCNFKDLQGTNAAQSAWILLTPNPGSDQALSQARAEGYAIRRRGSFHDIDVYELTAVEKSP